MKTATDPGIDQQSGSSAVSDADAGSDNRVFLRGRLAEAVVERDLPSGDVLATFRLTVTRPPGERVRVDSLECVTLSRRTRRILGRAVPGDVLEVEGSLQRRFWRSPSGPASRYAVAVDTVRRLPAPKKSAATDDPQPVSRKPRNPAGRR